MADLMNLIEKDKLDDGFFGEYEYFNKLHYSDHQLFKTQKEILRKYIPKNEGKKAIERFIENSR